MNKIIQIINRVVLTIAAIITMLFCMYCCSENNYENAVATYDIEQQNEAYVALRNKGIQEPSSKQIFDYLQLHY